VECLEDDFARENEQVVGRECYQIFNKDLDLENYKE
jgi:hypothetical protein